MREDGSTQLPSLYERVAALDLRGTAASQAVEDSILEKLTVTFEPVTMTTSVHVAYEVRAGAAVVADLINPSLWKLQPFFVESSWVDVDPDPVTKACSGRFYEHLDFDVADELLRSVENLLTMSYSGWDPDDPADEIACEFNLYSSVDHLLSIDRGWLRATMTDGDPMSNDEATWRIAMKKDVRFGDPSNSLLAPMLLSYWQESVHEDAVHRARMARSEEVAR